ncbi:MAG TPA: hypothetical protein VIH52_01395 [Candidatus Nanoarchaeia archaeon]|nr:hypothetical protein [uncultured archaeon]
MLVNIVLIILYGIFVGVSIFTLGNLRLFHDKINFQSLSSVFFSLPFWVGLFFALLARVTFIIINSQLSRSNLTGNASTSLTFIITLSSLIAVIILNYFVLGEKLTASQLVGTGIIVLGILMLLRV